MAATKPTPPVDVDTRAAGALAPIGRSHGQLMWLKFKEHRVALVSLWVLVVLYFVAIFAEFFAPYDPRVISTSIKVNSPPELIRFVDQGRFQLRPFVYHKFTEGYDMDTGALVYRDDHGHKKGVRFFIQGAEYKLWGLFRARLHFFGTDDEEPINLFGTDDIGRDLLSRTIYGGRLSMSVGMIGVLASLVLGTLLGGISGYFGGAVDNVIQRIIELLRSIPHIPLWLALSAAIPKEWSAVQRYFSIVVILSLIGWTDLARVVRGKFLALREEEYVMASRALGAGGGWVITRHLIPNFIGYLIVSLSLGVPGMIIGETALSFLGLGLLPPAISWGVLLKEAETFMAIAFHPWFFIPAILVIIVVLAFNFVGDGLRDAADPFEK